MPHRNIIPQDLETPPGKVKHATLDLVANFQELFDPEETSTYTAYMLLFAELQAQGLTRDQIESLIPKETAQIKFHHNFWPLHAVHRWLQAQLREELGGILGTANLLSKEFAIHYRKMEGNYFVRTLEMANFHIYVGRPSPSSPRNGRRAASE
jgi:hypothetical protein